MDQLDQLEASELEYNSRDDSFSDIESDSSLGADISSPPPSPNPSLNSSSNLSLSEPSISSGTSPKHSIGARIQALTYLELGLPIFQIEAKTGIKKT